MIFVSDYPSRAVYIAYRHGSTNYVPMNYCLRKDLTVHYYAFGYNQNTARQKFEEAYEYTKIKKTTWGGIKSMYR
ncbi:MAG: hypothetical protein JXA60_01020 [Candidatus Coatesbacteria bacterium]|nr:hypothetical protein [Candidatus Coatesbacteria bacterium]